jgi:hypothetical protein
MARQFLRCRFNPWDKRSYTYHHDGEIIEPGDVVLVGTPRGEREVTVDGVSDAQPAFETKPILKRVRSGDAPPGLLL